MFDGDSENLQDGDYKKIIREIMDSRKKTDGFFSMGGEINLDRFGVVATGYVLASAEDISSKAYVQGVRDICNMNEYASTFISAPVFDDGKYVVYFVLFKDRISYNNYSIYAHEKGLFDGFDTAPYLFN